MSAQVDHDLLADYVGGALEGTAEAEQVAQLIATSPAWRAAAEELTLAMEALADDLAVLRRTEEKMPSDIAARFDELFSSPEFARREVKAPVDPLAPRKPVRSGPRKKLLRKWAVPVAMLAAVFGFFAINSLQPIVPGTSQPANAPRENATADLAETKSAPVPTMTSGRHHNRNSLSSGSRMMATEGAAPQTSKSFEAPPSGDVSVAGGSIPSELLRLIDPVARQACLDVVSKALPGTPTYVDYAYFENQPALVIWITTQGGPWIFVAGPNCGIKDAHEIYRAPLK